MALAAIGSEIHQPLDVHGNLAAQIALDREAPDLGAQPLDFGLREVLDLGVRGNARRREMALRTAVLETTCP